jgi:hypothetical protein
MLNCYIRRAYVGNKMSFHFADHNHSENLVGGFGLCDTIYYISLLISVLTQNMPFGKYERSQLVCIPENVFSLGEQIRDI